MLNRERRVTIMIPTYNQSDYIEKCIESALAQDYPFVDIFISDDSTDNLTEIIVKNKYLDKLNVLYTHNKPSLGRVKNYRKTLIEKAKGDLILNLDGDDWLYDNTFISTAINIFNQDENIGVVMARKKNYHEESGKYSYDKPMKFSTGDIVNGRDYLYEYANGNVHIHHLTALYDRQKALEIDFYNKDLLFADGESIMRMMCEYDVGIIDECIGVWRIHTNNQTHIQNNISDLSELFTLENSLAVSCSHSKVGEITKEDWILTLKIKHIKWLIYELKQNKQYLDILYLLLKIFKYDKKMFFEVVTILVDKVEATFLSKDRK